MLILTYQTALLQNPQNHNMNDVVYPVASYHSQYSHVARTLTILDVVLLLTDRIVQKRTLTLLPANHTETYTDATSC